MTVPQIAEIVLCTVFAVVGYLLGSIPLGRMLRKFADSRTGDGSGDLAALVLDGAKAGAACLLGWAVAQYLVQNHVPLGFRVDLWNTAVLVGFVTGAFAVIGHRFPVWLKFRGGSALAPTAGVAMAAVALLVAG